VQLAQMAKSRIEIPSVEIDGEMAITVLGSNGVDVIRKALTAGLELGQKQEKSSIEIYSLGSPRYKLRIVSPDYKEAEDILSSVLGAITKVLEKSSGTIVFTRK
jgi:translation initiation factor 2 subunit 1